jgi:hypothetical protein
MDNLIKLRIGLTIAAVVGLVPITILFAVGVVAFFIPLIFVAKSPPLGTLALIGAAIVSAFAIWSAWKIYALSMAAAPVVSNSHLLASGAVFAMILGMVLAYWTRDLPELTYIFLMPAIVSSSMLALTLKRAKA